MNPLLNMAGSSSAASEAPAAALGLSRKLGTAPLEQISAREALLATALRGSRSAFGHPSPATAAGLFGNARASQLLANANNAAAQLSLTQQTSLFGSDLTTPTPTQDILRDVYGIATAGPTGAALAARRSALDAAIQQRLRINRAQAIQQQAQALALADDMSPFAGAVAAANLRRQVSNPLGTAALLGHAAANPFSGLTAQTPASAASMMSQHAAAAARTAPTAASVLSQGARPQQAARNSPLTIGLQPHNVPNPDATLAALGNSIRKKNSPYIDASSIADAQAAADATAVSAASNSPGTKRRRTRGGVTEPFPERLHRMLSEVEEKGNSDIVSWHAHGRAFGVHDPTRFVEEVLPKYFKQSRLSSFQRQLNLYGFTRISSGPDTGGYYHELFLKGRPQLCIHMRRVGVPQGDDRRKLKLGSRRQEPDFYSMKPLRR